MLIRQAGQLVSPNAKCSGCLHYVGNEGSVGMCDVGQRPFNCGDGEDPGSGYAPVTEAMPDLPGDSAPVAQAPSIGDAPRVQMLEVSLGEEQVRLVKSAVIAAELEQRQSCDQHSHGAMQGQVGHFVPVNLIKCSCVGVSDTEIVKSITPKLRLSVRAAVAPRDLLRFVGAVRNAEHYEQPLRKSEIAELVSCRGTSLVKSLVGMIQKSDSEDWIGQFQGSPLLKEALTIIEEEINIVEEDRKRQALRDAKYAARRKLRAEFEAQMNKMDPDIDNMDDSKSLWRLRENLDIQKKRLTIKLMRMQAEALKDTTVDKPISKASKRGLTKPRENPTYKSDDGFDDMIKALMAGHQGPESTGGGALIAESLEGAVKDLRKPAKG